MVFLSYNTDKKALAEIAVREMINPLSSARRRDMKKRIDFFYGNQLPYLTKDINDQFEFPDRVILQKEIYNVTQLIIDEVAVLYSEEPIREVNSKNEKDNQLYSEIAERGGLNLAMETVNQMVKLCKTVLLKPVWRNEQIEFDVLTPDMFDIVHDPMDKTKAKAIVYASYLNIDNNVVQNPDVFEEKNTVFYYWSADYFFVFTYNISEKGEISVQIMKDDSNPEGRNPYGVIPMVVVRDGYPLNDFFIEGGNDLIISNEVINIKITELNYLTKMQSFGIPVRKGAEGSSPITLDPSMTIDIPGDSDTSKGGDFRFVSPDAKITEMQKEIEQKLRRVALKYKLNPDMFVASGNRSSAESLQLQSYHLGKLIKRDKPLFRTYEKQIFELVKIVQGYHAEAISEDATLFVDFKDIEMPTTPADRDAHNLLLYQNGLISKSRWLMTENPDIENADQALAILQEISDENKLFATTNEDTPPEKDVTDQEIDSLNQAEKKDTEIVKVEPDKE